MTISVTFTPHRTVRVSCGAETIEVPLPEARSQSRDPMTPLRERLVVAPVAPAETGRRPVIALVQNDDVRHALPAEALARAREQAVARSPVKLAEVEDFNVTQLSMRALEDDMRDADDGRDQPLLLDVHADPAGLDDEITLQRLRRIVSDRSNPIDVIRLLGPFEAT